MPANTKVNLNSSDQHQPASVQMNKRFYLISRDKEFSNQFSVHILINNINKQHGSPMMAAVPIATLVMQSRDLGQQPNYL